MKSEIKTTSRILALFSYLFFFFGIGPLICWLLKMNDEFVKYHAKHAAKIFFIWLAVNIVTLPIKMTVQGFVVIRLLIGIAFLIFWILGVIYSIGGKKKAVI
jgi:uncharacterized membrane protein